MADEERKELTRSDEILLLIEQTASNEELKEALADYHENDIAEALEELDANARDRLYELLGVERFSEVLTYTDEASEVLKEFTAEEVAEILDNMDADDAVDVLESIDDEQIQEEIISHMDDEAAEDVQLIRSYDDDELGSMMTTNFVVINKNATVKEAMRSLIAQAEENDNIETIYVVDENEKFYGVIKLPDLIVARQTTELESIISHSYPTVSDTEKISESVEMLRSYQEDSIPVLSDEERILGVLTIHDILEMVDDEMGDDYAKFAGLTEEIEADESLGQSIRKRIPWLILLLGLGFIVSSVQSAYESVVSAVAVIVCFQSMILDMSGNVGTQSLAVTIRLLTDDEIKGIEKLKFILKEVRTSAINGIVIGVLSLGFITVYLHFVKNLMWFSAFNVGSCVGIALVVGMSLSGLTGSVIPIIFHKMKVDPAAASGPLITTINDLVASIVYYSLARFWLM